MLSGKKLLLALLLLPFVVYAGIKAYIHHNVKSTLTDLVATAAPFASIHYDGIGSTLGGKISIEGIKVQPTGLTDVVHIKDIEIQTPGLKFLLFGSRKIRDGEFPEKMQLALHGVTLDLDGQMMDMLDRFLSAAADSGAVRAVSHCGDIQYFGPRQYRKLGYDTLVMDMTLGYEYEKVLERLRMQMEWQTRDMASFKAEFIMSGGRLSLRESLASPPRMTAVNAVYKDLSITDRMKRYCASASGTSAEEYINAEVDQSDAAYLHKWGFVPGPGIRAAYRQFLQNPGEVRIEARSPEGIDPASLKLFRPEDAVSMLNLGVKVNGTAVTDLSYRRAAADEPATAGKAAAVPGGESVTARPAPGTGSARAEPEVTKSGYRAVRLGELPQHLGRQVRVFLIGNVVREGMLAEVQGKELVLERRYAGGAMTVRVAVNRIEKIEVLY